jgi:hypothetical protein
VCDRAYVVKADRVLSRCVTREGLSWTVRLHKISDPSDLPEVGGSVSYRLGASLWTANQLLFRPVEDTPPPSSIVLIDGSFYFWFRGAWYALARSLQPAVRSVSRTNDPSSGHASVHLLSVSPAFLQTAQAPEHGTSTFSALTVTDEGLDP